MLDMNHREDVLTRRNRDWAPLPFSQAEHERKLTVLRSRARDM